MHINPFPIASRPREYYRISEKTLDLFHFMKVYFYFAFFELKCKKYFFEGIFNMLVKQNSAWDREREG